MDRKGYDAVFAKFKRTTFQSTHNTLAEHRPQKEPLYSHESGEIQTEGMFWLVKKFTHSTSSQKPVTYVQGAQGGPGSPQIFKSMETSAIDGVLVSL